MNRETVSPVVGRLIGRQTPAQLVRGFGAVTMAKPAQVKGPGQSGDPGFALLRLDAENARAIADPYMLGSREALWERQAAHGHEASLRRMVHITTTRANGSTARSVRTGFCPPPNGYHQPRKHKDNGGQSAAVDATT